MPESSMPSLDDMADDLQASLDPDWMPHSDAGVDLDTTSTTYNVRSQTESRSDTWLDPVDHSETRQSLNDDYVDANLDPPRKHFEKSQRTSAEAKEGIQSLPHIKAPVMSKRPSKIRDEAEKNIRDDVVGVNKGFTRINNCKLEYLDHGDWKKAVYHYRIRGKLLRLMDAQGRYEEEPERGFSLLDRTAFKVDQQSWHMNDRSKRPDCLFLWEDPNQLPKYTPEDWYDNGRIVLGSDGRPLKMWRELPLTISGQCEGFRMEAWRRLNPDIMVRDIVARMPRLTSKGKNLIYKDIKIPALANRCTRDRCRAGIKAWHPRDGSREKERRLMEMIPFEIQKQIVRENSTRCFRDLTDAEIAYIELGNKGTATSLKKAGPRLLTNEERRQRQDQKQKRAARSNKQIDVGSLQIHPVFEDAISKPGLNRIRVGDFAIPDGPRMKRERSEDLEDIYQIPKDRLRPKKRRCSPDGSSDLPSAQTALQNRPPTIFKGLIDSGLGESRVPEALRSYQQNSLSGYKYLEESKHTTQQISNDADEGFFPNNYIYPLPHNNYRSGPDFRWKTPTNAEEQNLVQEALEITHDDCQRYLGPFPHFTTNKTESYAFQLTAIQDPFNLAFDGSNSNGNLLVPPVLRSHSFWTGSMDGFRALPTAQKRPHSDYSGRGDNGVLSQTLAGNGIGDWEGSTMLGGFEQRKEDEALDALYMHDNLYGDTFSGLF
ncbi:MAG: hypothetical protein Q9186_006990 [Xanthomendoza sp. 1 TL-2023]